MTWLRAFAVWLVIIGVESVHGALRMKFLVPIVGDFRAGQICVFTGALLIFGIAWLFIRWIRAETARSLVTVGIGWVVLTVLFEAGLGRLALDYSWGRIFSEYDLSRGGLMSLGVVFLALAPLLAARLRGVYPGKSGDGPASKPLAKS